MTDCAVRMSPAEARRIERRYPSFCDFVDDALFHPRWGYYSAGGVRFGEGGHYDTYPLALSPLFGRMVAQYAHRLWRRLGNPVPFEICELGAGNGQLCADTLLWVHERARHERGWKAFAAGLRYRIVERSPALIARQRQQLGPLADSVVWSRADLSRMAARRAPFARCGLIVANEVLDCLAHHKVVPGEDGEPSVVFVIPSLDSRAVSHAQLERLLADSRGRRLTFAEVRLPVGRLPRLHAFLRRHYPEFFTPGPPHPPYFACPRIETLLANTARLYANAEALWIDYGAERDFHLSTAPEQRVFAGPPRSGATVYDRPGEDDITFMVDFSVVGRAARAAGWSVRYFGPQAELARRAGVVFDREAVELIVRHRALNWLLALAGVGPEREWRHAAIGWTPNPHMPHQVPVHRYVERSVREFLAERGSVFRLMVLQRARRSPARATRR